jgi:hypothetical protein
MVQKESAEQLISWVVNNFNDGIPIILTGDFNVIPSSQTVNILKNKGRFTDLWEICRKELNEGFTFSTKNPRIRIVKFFY